MVWALALLFIAAVSAGALVADATPSSACNVSPQGCTGLPCDRDALVALYAAGRQESGRRWSAAYDATWNTSVPVCHWAGVSCSAEGPPQRVTGLNLTRCGYAGPFSAANVNRLSALTSLVVTHVAIAATDFADASLTFPALRALSLEAAGIAGVPPWLGCLPALESCILSNNHFGAGSTLPEFHSSAPLQLVDVSANVGIGGPLPGHWVHYELTLRHVDVSGTAVSGGVPGSWAALRGVEFDGSGSQISGALPTWLTGAAWSSFKCNPCNFTGTLPAWGTAADGNAATALRVLAIGSPKLTGTVPDAWATLTGLVELRLDDAEVNGTVPRALYSLPQLSTLGMRNNRLSGRLPNASELGPKLLRLDLRENRFMNTPLPTDWARLPRAMLAFVSDNLLNTTLPPEWGDMHVHSLEMVNCSLQGGIPASWANATFDFEFSADRNNLTTAEGLPQSPVGVISLAKNALREVPCTAAFSGSAQTLRIETLDISFNAVSRLDLACLSRQVVRLSALSNRLNGSFPQLPVDGIMRDIDLSDNNFSALDVDVWPTQLKRFNLAYNRVPYVNVSRLLQAPSLCSLVLDFNDNLRIDLDPAESSRIAERFALFSAAGANVTGTLSPPAGGRVPMSGPCGDFKLIDLESSNFGVTGVFPRSLVDASKALWESPMKFRSRIDPTPLLPNTTVLPAPSCAAACAADTVFFGREIDYEAAGGGIGPISLVLQQDDPPLQNGSDVEQRACGCPIPHRLDFLTSRFAGFARLALEPPEPGSDTIDTWSGASITLPASPTGVVLLGSRPANLRFSQQYRLRVDLELQTNVPLDTNGGGAIHLNASSNLFERTRCESTSLLAVPYLARCDACPRHAICDGTSKFLARGTTWRPGPEYRTLVECGGGLGCLGDDRTGYECAEGFDGPLCASCAADYAGAGPYCLPCQTRGWALAAAVAIVTFYIVYVTVVVILEIREKDDDADADDDGDDDDAAAKADDDRRPLRSADPTDHEMQSCAPNSDPEQPPQSGGRSDANAEEVVVEMECGDADQGLSSSEAAGLFRPDRADEEGDETSPLDDAAPPPPPPAQPTATSRPASSSFAVDVVKLRGIAGAMGSKVRNAVPEEALRAVKERVKLDDDTKEKVKKLVALSLVLLKMLNNHVAFIGFVMTTKGGESVRGGVSRAFSVSTLVSPGSLDVFQAQIACLAPVDVVAVAWISLIALPVSLVGAMVLCSAISLWGAKTACGRNRCPRLTHVWQKLPVILTIVVSLQYAGLVERWAQLIPCDVFTFEPVSPVTTNSSTVFTLVADRTVDCSDAEFGTMRVLVWAFVVTVAFGVPVLCVGLVLGHAYRQRRKRIDQESAKWGKTLDAVGISAGTVSGMKNSELAAESLRHAVSHFCFLTSNFRIEAWFWETTIMARKALCVVVITAVQDTQLQLVFLRSIFFGSIALHAFVQPYATRDLNRCEYASLFNSIALLEVISCATRFEALGEGGFAFLFEMLALSVIVLGLLPLFVVWLLETEFGRSVIERCWNRPAQSRPRSNAVRSTENSADAAAVTTALAALFRRKKNRASAVGPGDDEDDDLGGVGGEAAQDIGRDSIAVPLLVKPSGSSADTTANN